MCPMFPQPWPFYVFFVLGLFFLLLFRMTTVTLYAAEDDRKLDREKFHSTHANSHLPNGELGGYGYNANNI